MAGKNSPTGRWFFKCIRECEFDGKVWKPDEQFVVPAGTEVPKECFQEMELLPWLPRVDSGRSGERSGTEMARKKSPTGTWFFKCIRECEFAKNVWEPDEVIAVPPGTKVPAKAFKEIGRLPYDSACLVLIYRKPAISVGQGKRDYVKIDKVPDFALRAVKATPSFRWSLNDVILSIKGPNVKWAFLEAGGRYIERLREAVEESGNQNMIRFPPFKVCNDLYREERDDRRRLDMVARRKFEWNLLEGYDHWAEAGKPGSFEQWLDRWSPNLFLHTGESDEDEAPAPTAPAQEKADTKKLAHAQNVAFREWAKTYPREKRDNTHIPRGEIVAFVEEKLRLPKGTKEHETVRDRLYKIEI
jgi:hypothetical protein